MREDRERHEERQRRPGCRPGMRPMRSQRLHLARNCSRWRTVSADLVEQVGQRAADLALDVDARSRRTRSCGEPRRSAMACSASSFGRPRRISFATRPNSLAGRLGALLIDGLIAWSTSGRPAATPPSRRACRAAGPRTPSSACAPSSFSVQVRAAKKPEREQRSSDDHGNSPPKPAGMPSSERGAELDVEHLGGAQRQVGLLDQERRCSSRT